MRIVKLQAENVKRLRAVEITPLGSVVQITGANGAGKTSVLDCIWWALAGTKGISSRPVREGEESAHITLDLGEMVVTRKFKADGSSTLLVKAADGQPLKSPQSVLDALMGSLTFDPLAFSRMKADDQRATLTRMLGIDQQLATFGAENERDYALRTERNREAKALAARIEAIPVSAGDVSAVDVPELLEQLRQRDEINRRATYTVQRIAELRARADKANRDAEDMRAQADRLDAQGKIDAEEAETLSQEQVKEDNTEPLRAQIANAQAINAEVARRAEREKMREELKGIQAAADALTSAMAERETVKLELLKATPMPIAELGIDDTSVTYRGVPFDQASGAEQLRVSAAIAMASNPKLRIMRIKDGSLLDERSLGMLEALADNADWQIWIEMVDTSGEVGVVIEDGMVKADNQISEAA